MRSESEGPLDGVASRRVDKSVVEAVPETLITLFGEVGDSLETRGESAIVMAVLLGGLCLSASMTLSGRCMCVCGTHSFNRGAAPLGVLPIHAWAKAPFPGVRGIAHQELRAHVCGLATCALAAPRPADRCQIREDPLTGSCVSAGTTGRLRPRPRAQLFW